MEESADAELRMKKHLIAALCLVLLAGAGLAAQSGNIRLGTTGLVAPRFAERWRPASLGGETRVIGSVIDIRQVPVAGARVRLRNLANGAVEEEVDSDANGEYQFTVEDSGSYVVEMVIADGNVLALSNAGSLGRYETLRTVVQLPGRWDSQLRAMTVPQNAGSFVGASAANTMTATTLSIAVDQNITPVSAGEPVSAISQ